MVEEERQEQRPRGNTVLLTIIAVATLLVAVIGATFAYFSVTVSGNDNASSVIVRTGMLGITFNDGNEINFDRIRPGADLTGMGKTFTIVNTGDYDIPFSIRWNVVTNNFGQRVGADTEGPAVGVPWLGQSDFVYSLTGTGPGITGTNGVTNARLADIENAGNRTGFINITELTNITIPANATRDSTQTYTLSFNFPDTNAPQNYDQDRTFSAVLNVVIYGTNQFGG